MSGNHSRYGVWKEDKIDKIAHLLADEMLAEAGLVPAPKNYEAHAANLEFDRLMDTVEDYHLAHSKKQFHHEVISSARGVMVVMQARLTMVLNEKLDAGDVDLAAISRSLNTTRGRESKWQALESALEVIEDNGGEAGARTTKFLYSDAGHELMGYQEILKTGIPELLYGIENGQIEDSSYKYYENIKLGGMERLLRRASTLSRLDRAVTQLEVIRCDDPKGADEWMERVSQAVATVEALYHSPENFLDDRTERQIKHIKDRIAEFKASPEERSILFQQRLQRQAELKQDRSR